MKTLVYLAVPYSHPEPAVRQQRFDTVNEYAAEFMAAGVHIFSPISHTHPIALAGQLPTGFDFWRGYDEAIIRHCRELWVLCLPGWDQSVGVRAEIDFACSLGIPVKHITVS